MPRGLPDYYNPDLLVAQRVMNIEDVLTALRGLASVDNRGRIFWFDNCHEGPYGWTLFAEGNAVSPVMSAAKAESPPASLLLNCGTQAGSGDMILRKMFHIVDQDGLGVELGWLYWNQGPRMRIWFEYYTGGVKSRAYLEFDPTVRIFKIDTPSGQVSVYTVEDSQADGEWMQVKLVFHHSAGTYTRLIVGNHQVDLSAYSLVTAASALNGRLYLDLQFDAINAGVNTSYLGHVTITIDEP